MPVRELIEANWHARLNFSKHLLNNVIISDKKHIHIHQPMDLLL